MAFLVDERHLGTSEDRWLNWSGLERLPPLEVHPVHRALVVAPHPDDEVLGAGGLLSALVRAGTPVTLLAASDGEGSHPRSPTVSRAELAERRQQESRVAMLRLGCGSVRQQRLQLPDGQIRNHRDSLTEAIAAALDGTTLCIAPWEGDGHPDHDACGKATADACARTRASSVYYLVWAWHWAIPDDRRIPWCHARRLNLSPQVRARKRWASQAFVSQTRPLSHHPGDEAVLPGPVLRRAWRPFEVYFR